MNRDGGYALLRKPPGISSFAALEALKKRLGSGKIGHTGTLDRFADGLLVALCGPLTRLAPVVSGLDKCYEAVIRFGRETDTLDPEGKTVAEAPAPELDALAKVLPEFRGVLRQRPPAFSALHVNGRRSYAIARSGGIPTIAEREVTVHRIELLAYDPPDLSVRISCSKGTYVRSLARDIGLAAGSRAYVERLTRTAVGGFLLDRAVAPGDFLPARDLRSARELLEALGIECVAVGADVERAVRSGGKPPALARPDAREERLVALFDRAGSLLALVRSGTASDRYEFVVA